jgi:type IV pilus assembly protein PilY1
MNYKILKYALGAIASVMAFSSVSWADDTDIFTINPNVTSQRPNILIMVDNAANWSTRYAYEKAALVSTFNSLDSRFNVGVAYFSNSNNKENTAVPNSNITSGAVIAAAVRQMNDTNRPLYAAFVNELNGANGSGGDGGSNSFPALSLAEAYKYFSGSTQYAGAGYSNRDYPNNPFVTSTGNSIKSIHALSSGHAFSNATGTLYNSPISDACQKNYVIYIANGTADSNENNPAKSLLTAAGGNTATIPLTPSNQESNWADEWARFLANNDINSTYPGEQNIITYTLEIAPGTNAPDIAMTKLLQSMATQGKGKYFSSDGNTAAIVEALNNIFDEIQAKNTVFASSTLPVSVNVRGTYLNQVYMGVFRPDGYGNPRWVGNLKEYKLGLDGTGTQLVLQDKNGLSAANTSEGFISPIVTSFWTTSSSFWDTSYYDTMVDSSGGASDAPDGDLVEKGGVAQKLRAAYATNQSTRALYTCSGTCTGGSSLSGSLFDTSNSNLTDAVFGISGPQSATLSRTANASTDYEVTAAVSNHGYSTGDAITIAGATQSAYNGTFPITVVDANTFKYTITVSPTTPATGTPKATIPGAAITVTSISYNGTTATATAAGHTFVAGDVISLSGTPYSAYNTSFTISSVVAGTSFSFPVTQQPVTGGGGIVTIGATTYGIDTAASSGITRTGTTVVVKTTSNLPTSATSATITGASPSEYNGTWSVTVANNKKTLSFTLPSSSITPPTTTTGTFSAAKATGTSVTLLSLSRVGTTVTADTGTTNLGLSVGNQISISNATESEYNGTYSVTAVDNTDTSHRKFTYTIVTTPASPATTTGTITASSGAVNKTSLIAWVRGQNVLMDDNPNGLSSSVRGYLHGDVVHSRPLVVNYNRNGLDNGTDIVVFYGANDGILHAVKGGKDDTDGTELWGFIPTEFMPQLKRLYQNSPVISSLSKKPYFFDGPIGIYMDDHNNDKKLDTTVDASDKVYLYLTARRGARLIYALDVSDPANPKLLWKKTNSSTDYSELGYTWSEPKVGKIRGYTNPVLIFGAGYDPTAEDASTQGTATMGRGLFIVDAFTGAVVKTFGPADGLTFPVPGDVVALNSNFDPDNYLDRVYFADTGGRVWRLNIGFSSSATTWDLHRVATVGGGGRKFLFSPDVIYNTTYDAVLIGSGDREHPLDTTATNRFYMFKDSKTGTPPDPDNEGDGIEEADLCDVTDYYTSSASVNTCLASNAKYGWYYTLDPAEKVVGSATSQNQTVFFGTNVPSSVINQAGYCGSDLGEGRIYALDARNGRSTIDLSGNGVLGAEDAYTVYPGGGLPPSPTPVTVQLNDGQPCEGENCPCTGENCTKEGTCFGPTCLVPPSLEYNQRYRSFWYFEGEN